MMESFLSIPLASVLRCRYALHESETSTWFNKFDEQKLGVLFEAERALRQAVALRPASFFSALAGDMEKSATAWSAYGQV
jgi:hypothetical protein